MAAFKGFPEGKTPLIPIPEPFFRALLPEIDDLDELKVTLYFLWRLTQMEGSFRWLRREDFLADPQLLRSLSMPTPAVLEEALRRAIARGVILAAQLPPEQGGEVLYFLNSPRGRLAVRQIAAGEWRGNAQTSAVTEPTPPRPNIYQLYEENFGPLTPLLADMLKEAEESYPAEWIEDAIRQAVANNKRTWRYVSAILERWRREGKHGRKKDSQARGDTEQDRRRYVEGEFSDFIEH